MLEILKFIFSGFDIFVGVLTLLWLCFAGIAEIIRVARGTKDTNE